MDKGTEALTISFGDRNLAIEFAYVQEISVGSRVIPMPCLPPHYLGLCNHMGNIFPVVFFGEKQEEPAQKEEGTILILNSQTGVFGVWLKQEPSMITLIEGERVMDHLEKNMASLWEEKAVFQKDGMLYVLLDVEKTADNLVVCR